MTAKMRITFAETQPGKAARKKRSRPKKDFTIADYKKTAKESDIQLAIRQILNLIGVPHSVTDASRAFTDTGRAVTKVDPDWPDLSCTLPWPPHRGISLYVETKAARTGITAGQQGCHRMLREAGAIVIVPRSVDDFVRDMLLYGIDHRLLREMTRDGVGG